jgi:hypothetical protein
MNSSLSPPIFRKLSVRTDGEWSGFLIRGMAQMDGLALARAYKQAADAVVSKANKSSDLAYELACPALHLYRHAIELYLKLIVRPNHPDHSIANLARAFRTRIRSELDRDISERLMSWLREFDEIDPRSQTFGYTTDERGQPTNQPSEFCVSFRRLRRIAGILLRSFEKAHSALGK